MNLSGIRQGDLKEVFDALEEAFHVKSVDFYLIGALARNIWFEKGSKNFRSTKDLDFAVFISNRADFEAVRSYLIIHKDFRETRDNSFLIISPSGTEVDLLPFGEIDFDNGLKSSESEAGKISINGFLEVYLSGTEMIKLITGHSFNVATLPAIVLLKLIAYDDRPEIRLKDARDILNILTHYFDLQSEIIYEYHAGLFGEKERSLREISAVVIGREMKNIVADNFTLATRISDILITQIQCKERSAFVRNMVNEDKSNVEEIVLLLNNILDGFTEI